MLTNIRVTKFGWYLKNCIIFLYRGSTFGEIDKNENFGLSKKITKLFIDLLFCSDCVLIYYNYYLHLSKQFIINLNKSIKKEKDDFLLVSFRTKQMRKNKYLCLNPPEFFFFLKI